MSQDRSPNVARVQALHLRLGKTALADRWRSPGRERTLPACVLDEPIEAATAKGRQLYLDLVGPGRSVRRDEELDRSRPIGLLEDRSPVQRRRAGVGEVDSDRFSSPGTGAGTPVTALRSVAQAETLCVVVEVHVECVVLFDAFHEAGRRRLIVTSHVRPSRRPEIQVEARCDLLAKLLEAWLQTECVQACHALLRALEPLGRVGRMRQDTVPRDHLLRADREHAGHVVADQAVESERIVVDLLQSPSPVLLVELLLVAQVRDRPLDRWSQDAQRHEVGVEELHRRQRQMSGDDTELVPPGLPALEQVRQRDREMAEPVTVAPVRVDGLFSEARPEPVPECGPRCLLEVDDEESSRSCRHDTPLSPRGQSLSGSAPRA